MALHTLNTKKMLIVLVCITSLVLLCACGSFSELLEQLPPLPTESSGNSAEQSPVVALPAASFMTALIRSSN